MTDIRKALIVGIDHYQHVSPLSGCVNDAYSVKRVLERHDDNTINFATPRVLSSSHPSSTITKVMLKESVQELFNDNADIALFYFAGHGYIDDTGGYLCAGDHTPGDDGLSLSNILTLANNSPAKNKVIILDSCHSGIAGNHSNPAGPAEIKEGITILTASTARQSAMEIPGGGAGVFTSLLVDALEGAAANLVGHITPGSVYAHIDQSLGSWKQRPVFKTNVTRFVSLRKVTPPIPLAALQALATHFPKADYKFQLDPAYEPERSQEQKDDPNFPKPDPEKTAVFAVLQQYVKVNLVRAVDAPHMWHAAMGSKFCQLTVLGQHYQRLVLDGLI